MASLSACNMGLLPWLMAILLNLAIGVTGTPGNMCTYSNHYLVSMMDHNNCVHRYGNKKPKTIVKLYFWNCVEYLVDIDGLANIIK